MDTDALLLLIVAITALAAAFFTVVPVLPGAALVPVGALACGWVDGFERFPTWFWLLQGALVIAALLVDQLAQVVGVRRAGGSRQAMWGGAIGVFVGPIVLAFVVGPFALLIGPPIGAVVGTIAGEEYARSRATGRTPEPAGRGYHRLGLVALVAFAIGTAIKLALVSVQVGVLLYAVR